MKFLDIFKGRAKRQPEDDFTVTITDASIKVEYPKWPTGEIQRNSIKMIKLVNTDAGPVLPDIWLVLADDNQKCIIPHGCKGFDEVYEIVSKYTGFDFANFGRSMTCTDNAEFSLWTKEEK